MSPRPPGRDRRAVLHHAAPGAARVTGHRVAVIGGGIAGLSAALTLADRGVEVELLEKEHTWGGRVRSWDLDGERSMSRGFHAFFRQYYTLRSLLTRAGGAQSLLASIGDYPLQSARGPRDSFRGIPRTPPLSIAAFALRSRSFPLAQLAHVNVRAALALLRTEFPAAFCAHDGRSAQDLLDELRFPPDARHLALEVFARSFFADPRAFSAGELVGMFHTYFMGSAEGLIFDVPTDAYSPLLWDPLVRELEHLGGRARSATAVTAIERVHGALRVHCAGPGPENEPITTEAVVIAADPRSARALLRNVAPPPGPVQTEWARWLPHVLGERNAPPFAVQRLWLDQQVPPGSPAFLGTSGYGPLDNVSVLERFEATAARWTREHRGSVVELHAYALAEGTCPDELRGTLRTQLERVHPELRGADVLAEELLVRDDGPLIGTGAWADRPTVFTPDPALLLAGDWLRTDEPVALMERAALTGVRAADALLSRWGAQGHDTWSVPLRGVLAPRARRRHRRS